MSKTLKIKWFARGGGVAAAGPFRDQIEATKSMKLMDGGFPLDVFVWPERVVPGTPWRSVPRRTKP